MSNIFGRHGQSCGFLKPTGGRIINAEITNSLVRDITLILSIYFVESFHDKMNSAAISALINAIAQLLDVENNENNVGRLNGQQI